MNVVLPRGLEIDLDNIPSDFEEQIKQCFVEYTAMTNPDFMYHDKLCFIDRMTELLHGNRNSDDAVMDLMKDRFEYEVSNNGEFPNEYDFLNTEFMEDCYRTGKNDMKLYSHEWLKGQRKHDDDKIMQLLCRTIKAVMDYQWGSDGV